MPQVAISRTCNQGIKFTNTKDNTQIRVFINKITPSRVALYVEAPTTCRVVRKETIT